MKTIRESSNRMARLVLTGSLGLICLAIAGAPWLALSGRETASDSLYLCFSFVCHQIPERSFSFHGYPWAVCQRCAGVYWGMFLGTLLPQVVFAAAGDLRRRRSRVLAASLPMLLDWAIPLTGVWRGSALSRFSTGMVFGLMLTSLLVPALAELFAVAIRRHGRAGTGDLQGVAT